MFKIATWNVNSIKVRLEHVIDWVETNQPSVLAIQETKSTDETFPEEELKALGYEVTYAGQKTYNGVAVLSKSPIERVSDSILSSDDAKRYLECVIEGYRVLNVYVPNGQAVGSDKYAYKLEWLAALDKRVSELLKQGESVILLGDFNIAPADEDVHDPKSWEEAILCSTKERAALEQLLSHGMCDSFRLFEQDEKLFSWWDYRRLGFQLNKGLRIDLILIADHLKEHAKSCVIDKAPRKLERPSDHAPVMLTLGS